jgi:hypothetical protein
MPYNRIMIWSAITVAVYKSRCKNTTGTPDEIKAGGEPIGY